ncbi:MAG: sugar nucleotide-binding protein [Gammaproteobacteria bacterium]|nr:sugar nucleotide-binding protein [Gammaproteobacteria bacterium]
MTKNKQFVIVGANGPIGASFCRVLKSLGQQVMEISHTPTPGQIGYDFLADSPEKLNLDKRTDYVFILCSGYSNLAQCRRNPEISHQFNVTATQALLEYAREFKVLPVFLSSDYVFDGAKSGYVEADLPNPLNLYGEQKLIVEEFIKARFENYLIFRSSKILGFSRQIWAIQQLQELRASREILCFTNRFYAPIFVNDIPLFMLAAIERQVSGIFHLAQDKLMTPFEMMSTIARETNLPSNLVIAGLMKSRELLEPCPENTYLINDKAKKGCDFHFTPFDDFLAQLKLEKYQLSP